MSKRNKNHVLTETHNKVMIRDGELRNILNRTELQAFYDIINKIKEFDRKGDIKNDN